MTALVFSGVEAKDAAPAAAQVFQPPRLPVGEDELMHQNVSGIECGSVRLELDEPLAGPDGALRFRFQVEAARNRLPPDEEGVIYQWRLYNLRTGSVYRQEAAPTPADDPGQGREPHASDDILPAVLGQPGEYGFQLDVGFTPKGASSQVWCAASVTGRFRIDDPQPPPAGGVARPDPYVNWNWHPEYARSRLQVPGPEPAQNECARLGVNHVGTFEYLDEHRVFSDARLADSRGRWYFVNECEVRLLQLAASQNLTVRVVFNAIACAGPGVGSWGVTALHKKIQALQAAEASAAVAAGRAMVNPKVVATRLLYAAAAICGLWMLGSYMWAKANAGVMTDRTRGCGVWAWAPGRYSASFPLALNPGATWNLAAYPVGAQPHRRLASTKPGRTVITEERCDLSPPTGPRIPDVPLDAFNTQARINLGEPMAVWSSANPPYLVAPPSPVGPGDPELGFPAEPPPPPPVIEGALLLENTSDYDQAEPGQPVGVANTDQAVTHRLHVTADADTTDVVITDTLADGAVLVDAGDGCSQADGVVTCPVGDLAAGDSATREVTVTHPDPGTHVNTVEVTGTTQTEDEPSAETVTDGAINTTVVPMPGLYSLLEGPATADPGEEVTYTLRAHAVGLSLTGVELRNFLPPGAEVVEVSPDCTYDTRAVTCQVGTLPAGEYAEATMTLSYGDASLYTSAKTNWMVTTSDEAQVNEDAEDLTVAVTEVGPPVDLTASKTGPARAAADEDVTYTLTASVPSGGTGGSSILPVTAADVHLQDVLPEDATFVSASPDCVYDEADHTVDCPVGDLAPGEQASAEVTVAYPDPGSYDNVAVASSANGGWHLTQTTTTITPPGPGPSRLTVEASGPALEVVPLGEIATYTVTVTASGRDYPDVTLDAWTWYPYGYLFTFESGTPNCRASGPAPICELGTISAGESVTATLNLSVVGRAGDQTICFGTQQPGRAFDCIPRLPPPPVY